MLVAATAAGQDAQGPDFFVEQVAPILQRRCLPCHDQEHRKGDFSLQTEADLADTGYVQPGDARGSYLLEMVTPTGERAPSMPKDSDPLSAEQVDILRRWIEAGADWPDQHQLEPFQVQSRDWWSWKPLQTVPVPPVPDAYRDWARTPIDAFILQQLLSNNLRPSAEADRATLIRRLSYDLTGLPPTPDEIQSFVRDPDAQAYQRLLNRLLDSPRYGEHWARHWLDIVHYGDSHGYDKDKPRPNAWPYRDYVIRSFNQDKPYHRFVQEQIAGDVLWPETIDGLVATGFIAAGPWDFIGHAEVPENKLDGKVARNLDRDDMVTNTLNTFCSLTIQCARCHNHKLDAVTMQDYYRLQAVFAAIDRADRPFDADPEVAQRRSALQQQHDDLQQALADLQQELEELKSPELKALEGEIAELQARLSQSAVSDSDRSPAYGYHSQVADKPDTVKWVQVDLGAVQPIDTLILFGADEYGWADFGFPDRFRIEVSDDVELDQSTVVVDHTQQGFERPGSKPVVFTFPGVSARYVRITATELWSRRRLGQPVTDDWIFALGELVAIGQGQLRPIDEVTALDTIEALPRWGRQNLADGIYGRAALNLPDDKTRDTPDDSARVAAQLLELAQPDTQKKDLDRLVGQAKAMLKQQAGPERLQRQAQLVDSLAAVGRQQQALPKPSLVYAGMVYEGSGAFRGRKGLGARDIHILERGDVSQPGERVRPGTVPLMDGVPAVFDLDDDHAEAERRAALANWITHTDHPLTWRSIVNRVWLYHFGRGIVDSPNDFGRGGKLPSHPELLDWLAADFRDGNQSLKQLHRLICSSAVYRQQSLSDPERAALDSDNRLLWRMNRRRLTAEEIRDSVVKAAGLLDQTMGGPGFMDFVIEHPEHSPHYQYHLHDPNDPQTHRRAVYRFLVRSQPQPLMNVLDCADPSVSVPKRDETLTALQALSLLNNDFMIVMSQRFAERLQRDHPQLPDQVRAGFAMVTGRQPANEELDAVVNYAQQFGLPNTCRWLFNLNEFVFLD